MLIARVRRTLEERELIPGDSLVLCACSGGPDSAAMLCALTRLAPQLRFRVEAASIDHGLRPDAYLDVAIASRQAAELAVPFHTLKIRVEAGGSLQARARGQRYQALFELARRLGAARIAIGHTQDDQAETVIARLLRGAGVRGLGAIDPRRDDGVVRPLIDCARDEVHRFARARFADIAWDQSNRDERFERVRIRTHLLPTLRAEDANLTRHLAELADEARETAAIVEQLGAALLERARADSETLDISVLRTSAAVLRRAALRHWLASVVAGPASRAELDLLDRAVLSGRGQVWISASHMVHAERGHLRLCPRHGAKG